MENAHIADILDEIADLLELQDDNPFRIRSYRNAAQGVRSLSDRLEDLAQQGKDLADIRNIGDSTAGKIHEILETGTCKRAEELRQQVPGGLPAIMRIPGVGPKKAMLIHEKLDVNTIDHHGVEEGIAEVKHNKRKEHDGIAKKACGSQCQLAA